MEAVGHIERIREKAFELGFADCGFARAEALTDDSARLKSWLEKNYHGRMGYMARNFEKRSDPRLLVEGARSVFSLLYNYKSSVSQHDPEAPVLSSYAYGRDYHFVLKNKMYALFDFMKECYPDLEGRVFVDSAPVLDRAWALRAGLGWIGKNSMLISRKAGSFVFIGEIISNIEIAENPLPEPDRCGNCSRCIDACPTKAILNDRLLDARRCISYQTIENKDEIPASLHEHLAGRVFGCDICQLVCPWNKKTLAHNEPGFSPDAELLDLSREDWLNMDRESFNKIFKDSPVKRAGFDKLKATLRVLNQKSR